MSVSTGDALLLEAQGLPLLPTRQAGFLGPSAVPEKVRLGDAGGHIVGYVVAQRGSVLSRKSPGYVIVVTVFDSNDAREDALTAEPRWVIASSRRVRTAQIEKNNLVATYGGRETEDGFGGVASGPERKLSGPGLGSPAWLATPAAGTDHLTDHPASRFDPAGTESLNHRMGGDRIELPTSCL